MIALNKVGGIAPYNPIGGLTPPYNPVSRDVLVDWLVEVLPASPGWRICRSLFVIMYRKA